MTKTFFTAVAAMSVMTAGTAFADDVEIYLTDMLDNVQSGYCLDIARAQGDAADPADGLQGHTCYSPSGTLGVDQAFDSEQFADGILYMTKFDVCTEVASTDAGTSIALGDCDGSEGQSFVFSGEGTIAPSSAPEMCLTLAEDTRTGRSDANQIKVLSLEACSDDLAAYQTWSSRTGL